MDALGCMCVHVCLDVFVAEVWNDYFYEQRTLEEMHAQPSHLFASTG